MNKKNGYVALISVLSISAVGLAIASALLILGVDSTKTSINIYQGFESRELAHACSELALQQIRDNVSYLGTNTHNIGNGSCVYTVASLGGQSREIISSGAVSNTIRREKIIISAINPNIIISYWQEIAN
jgi:hypothetical protein